MVPAPFIVVVDANVLFPLTLRDTVLRAAAAGFYQLRWSAEILAEMERNLVSTGTMSTAKPARTRHVPSPRPSQPAKPPADKVNADELFKEALQAWVRGDARAALALCKRVTQANPSYASAWRLLGLVYEKLGDKAGAHGAFQKYLQFSPGASDAPSIRQRLESL